MDIKEIKLIKNLNEIFAFKDSDKPICKDGELYGMLVDNILYIGKEEINNIKIK